MNDKVTIREKIAYFMANFGNIPVMNLINSYLLVFYTNICGLDPAACATLFLLARILDGVSDPVMGFVIDRMPDTKWGRFRPVLLIGSIICGINYLLLWFGPMMAPAGKLAIAYVSYLLIGWTFDIMDIALNSMLPVMTADPGERNGLSAIKGFAYMLGAVVIGVAAPLILGDVNNSGNFTILIGVFSAIIIVFSVVGALGVRERVKVVKDGAESYKIGDLFKIFAQKPVWVTFFVILMYTIGSNISSTTNTYYYTYVLGNLSLSSLVTLATLPTIIITNALSGKLVARFGKKPLYALGLAIAGCAGVIRLLDIHSVALVLVATVIAGIGSGLVMPLNYSIQADNTDYVELKLGHRAEGAIASLSSFISKCAAGIGGAIPGYLLALAGFDSSLATQPDGVINVIVICIMVLPIVFSLIGILTFSKAYPLGKKELAEQNEKIASLRGTEA